MSLQCFIKLQKQIHPHTSQSMCHFDQPRLGGGDVSHQLVNFNAMFGGLVILEVRLNWVISKRKKRKTFGL
tara:strand:- start:765 stop:977 length:213 start_codon:yes stop_codon:yes gene_type:complete